MNLSHDSRRNGALLRTLTALAALAIPIASFAGPLPTTLKILPNGPANSSIQITNIVYDGAANAGTPCKGQGTITISIAGITLPASANVPFMNVVADDTGQITRGGIALDKDIPAKNLFGSGIDLTI